MSNTSSNLIARLPSVGAAVRNNGTPAFADTFRARVRTIFDGNRKGAPIAGCERYIRMKLDGTKRLSIDEAVTIVRHVDDAAAVDLLRAVAVDAGKGERVHVALSSVQFAALSFDEAERECALWDARFLCAADDAKTMRLSDHSREARQLREVAIGAEARRSAVLRMAEGGAS